MTTTRWSVTPLDPRRDLDGVLDIDRASFTRPWTREMYRRELDRPDVSRVSVVRGPEDTVIGYCASWKILDELHINNLAVRPGWRRRGAGRALLDEVLDEAEREGATWATLEVRAANEAARGLYERAGFEVIRVRPRYYSRPPDDALVMARPLGRAVPRTSAARA